MDLKRYWKSVNETEASITEPFAYVMSEDDDSKGWVGGVVSQVGRRTAATLLVDKSHRLATKEELEKHFAAVEVAKENIAKQDARNVSSVLADRILGGSQVHRPAAKQADKK